MFMQLRILLLAPDREESDWREGKRPALDPEDCVGTKRPRGDQAEGVPPPWPCSLPSLVVGPFLNEVRGCRFSEEFWPSPQGPDVWVAYLCLGQCCLTVQSGLVVPTQHLSVIIIIIIIIRVCMYIGYICDMYI